MQFSTRAMIRHAEQNGYAIPAVNVFDEFSMRGVITAAERCSSPFILQISTKTARNQGVGLITDMFRHLAGAASVPLALHLDHCPDRGIIDQVIAADWQSLLFDASELDLATAERQTAEVVAQAHAKGIAVESEIENIIGVEDGVGSDEAVHSYTVEQLAQVAHTTGADLLAPQLGTAHGLYTAAPELLFDRARQVREASGRHVVLHGGTGLAPEEFQAFVDAGVSKINISTQCKIAYLQAGHDFLVGAEQAKQWDPPAYFAAVVEAVALSMAELPPLFGSAGRAEELVALA